VNALEKVEKCRARREEEGGIQVDQDRQSQEEGKALKGKGDVAKGPARGSGSKGPRLRKENIIVLEKGKDKGGADFQ